MIIIIADDQGIEPGEQPPVQAPSVPMPSPEPAPEPTPLPEPPSAPQVPPMRTMGSDLPRLIGEYLAAQEPDRSRLKQEIYSFGTDEERLKGIQQAYNATNDDDKRNQLIDLVFSCPVEFKSRKGAIRKAIGQQLSESFNEEPDAATATYTAIWKSLGPNVRNPYHRITYIWGHNKRIQPKGPEVVDNSDKNSMVAYRAFKPYILFLENPDSPPGGSKTVDPDLVDKVDNWEMDENAAVWQQYKRDMYRDRDGRIDKAIRWTINALRSIKAKAKESGKGPSLPDDMVTYKVDDDTLSLAVSLGIGNGPAVTDAEFQKKLIERGNDLYRARYAAAAKAKTGDFTRIKYPLDKPEWVQLAKVWLKETEKKTSPQDAPSQAPTPPISFDDWLIERLQDLEAKGAKIPEGTFRPAAWHPDGWIKAAKAILEQYGPSVGITPDQWKDETSPYFLNSAMVGIGVHGALGPKYVDMAKSKMRDARELGYVPTSIDPGAPMGLGRVLRPQKLPEESETPGSTMPRQEPSVDYRNAPEQKHVSDEIISPADIPGAGERKNLVSPENPKFRETIKAIIRELYSPFAMTGKSEDQMATDSVLSDIGNMMSKKFVPSNADEIHATKIRNADLADETFQRIKALLTEPLLLKHFPDDSSNSPRQRFDLAQMEVAKDINQFLADDSKMAEISKTLGIGLPKAAMLRNEIRRAMFLCNPSIPVRTAAVNPRIVEHIVEHLFGKTPKGAVAKFICIHRGPINHETEKKIKSILSKEYKREFKVLDSFLFDIIRSAQKGIAKFVKKVVEDDAEAEKIAKDLHLTAVEVKDACQRLAK